MSWWLAESESLEGFLGGRDDSFMNPFRQTRPIITSASFFATRQQKLLVEISAPRACEPWSARAARSKLTARSVDAGRTKGLKYAGQLFDDARRTGARNLRIAGVSEGVIVEIGGWRTRSVFERFNIKNQADSADALQKAGTE